MPTVCIDFDDTLVGYKKYGTPMEWLDGAVAFLRQQRRAKRAIVIHSCRANWPEGRKQIVDKLAEISWVDGRHYTIAEKPLAIAYVDDRAYGFRGDWTEVEIP